MTIGAAYALAAEISRTEAGQIAEGSSHSAVVGSDAPTGELELLGQRGILEHRTAILLWQYSIGCVIGCVSLLHRGNDDILLSYYLIILSANFPGN